MYIMSDVTLYYRLFTTAMMVQCDAYIYFVRSYVEVVKSLSYCSRKLSVSSTQTKPLTTKNHKMCNKVWLLQHLRVSNHAISPIFFLNWAYPSRRLGCRRSSNRFVCMPIWAEFFSCLWSCLSGSPLAEISQQAFLMT